jgi:hypothetical protein
MRLRQTLDSESNKNEWTVDDHCTWLRSLFSASGKTSNTGTKQSPAWHYSNVGRSTTARVSSRSGPEPDPETSAEARFTQRQG